jgi:hypothetical protein
METMLRESSHSEEPLLVHIVGDRTSEHSMKPIMAADGTAAWSQRRVSIGRGEGISVLELY